MIMPLTSMIPMLWRAPADRRHVLSALERTNWVIAGPAGAAAQLGIKRSTLQFRMREARDHSPGAALRTIYGSSAENQHLRWHDDDDVRCR